MFFVTCSQYQIHYCYTDRKVFAGAAQGELPEGQERVPWGITVPRNSLARCNARHLRILRSVQFIFVGPIYNNVLTNRVALSCRTLRKVTYMCSSSLSVNCEKAGKGTQR